MFHQVSRTSSSFLFIFLKCYIVDDSLIKSFSVQKNHITPSGMSTLLETIKDCCPLLESFKAYGNPINDACVPALISVIEKSYSLTWVCIGGPSSYEELGISDAGVENLSQSIIGNTRLKYLDIMSWKRITSKSTPIFVEMASKSCLERLCLFGTAVTQEDQNMIDALLQIPNEEREIPVFSTSKSAAKATFNSSSSLST